MLRECASDGLDFLFGGVIEMAARSENLESFKASSGDLPEKFRVQPSRDEQVSREDSLHRRVLCPVNQKSDAALWRAR